MSIYIDVRMLRSAGIGTYLKNILPYLKDLPAVLLIREKDINIFPWLQSFKIQLFDDPIYSIREQIYYQTSLKPCDLFWSPHVNVPYFSIRAKKRLVTIHDVYHLAFISTLKLKEKLYAKKIYQKAVEISDRIITDSDFSKQEILKYTKVSEKKIKKIHCGVDSSFFSKKDDIFVARIKKKYHLAFPYFLFVGNIKPHKNLKNVLKALQNVSHSYHLVVVGKSQSLLNQEDLPSLLEELRLKSRVHIFSDVKDEELPIFYQESIATIFPSLYEGFGLPILEAMACGCSVLTSNIASIPEVGGDAVCYFDPLNANEIASKMNEIGSNGEYRKKFIQKGYERIRQFCWEKSAKSHKTVIKSLI